MYKILTDEGDKLEMEREQVEVLSKKGEIELMKLKVDRQKVEIERNFLLSELEKMENMRDKVTKKMAILKEKEYNLEVYEKQLQDDRF